MNVGKLYQVKKYFWYLFPSKDIAASTFGAVAGTFAAATAATAATYAASDAAYWSKRFNCNVSYVAPNSIFVLLEQDEKFVKVLTTNGEIGWIVYPENKDWTKGCIEEVNQ